MKIINMNGVYIVAATMLCCALSGINMAQAVEDVSETANAQKQEAKHWGQKVEGFRLSLRTDKEQYKLGEAIVSRIELKNMTSQDRLMGEYSGFGLTYKLNVIRPDGSVATLTSKGEKTKKEKKDIQRRSLGSLTYLIPVGKSRAFSLDGTNTYFDMMQPGEYLLQVSRQLPSLEEPENAKKSVPIYSNVVKITIAAVQEDDENAPED